jgi:general secretion pathway protein K
MAIAYVLWGVALLASLALSLLSGGTVSHHLARNGLQAAQVEALAEAAVARAVLGLLDRRPDRRWRVDGVPHDFVFAGETMRIAIQDELGRIDLNQADQSVLIGLFRSAGLEAQAADGLVDKILDWRDANPARRLNGAKDRDYRAAGFAYGPRNGPFQSVEELKLVMDMTPELFRRVAPALTVYSGRQFLDPRFAPREALLALPGTTPSAVANAVTSRERQPNGGTLEPMMSLGGRAFAIRIESPGPSGVLVREAVVRLTDDPLQPYWLLSWRMR